jgi:hypothetical protein
MVDNGARECNSIFAYWALNGTVRGTGRTMTWR